MKLLLFVFLVFSLPATHAADCVCIKEPHPSKEKGAAGRRHAYDKATAVFDQSPGNKWQTDIEKFEESDRQNPPPRDAVVFIGSSSVKLWQSLGNDFPGIKVINRGFGGSEIADSTFFADRILIPYHPRMIVLYAGDNDLASGKTPQQVFEEYKTFVERVQRDLPTTRIAFISIKASPARAALLQSMKEANALIRGYATHDKRQIFIDVFTPMLGKDGGPRPELFGPDKLHMNGEGYSLWKLVIAPYISRTVGQE